MDSEPESGVDPEVDSGIEGPRCSNCGTVTNRWPEVLKNVEASGAPAALGVLCAELDNTIASMITQHHCNPNG